MKRYLLVLIVVVLAVTADITAQKGPLRNRYGMPLRRIGNRIALADSNRVAQVVDLNKLTDLTEPYVYSPDKLYPVSRHGVEQLKFTYKSYEDYSLDLYVDLPSDMKGPSPVIFYIHGGGWGAGNPGVIYPLAYNFVRQGVASVRVAYSLIGRKGANVEMSTQDIHDAKKFIFDRAEQLRIDTTRFGFAGGSAGAHLAALQAVTTPGTAVLIGLFGAYDFTTLPLWGGLPKSGYFDPQNTEHFKEVSPLWLIPETTDISAVLAHGTADIIIPYSQSVSFACELERHGAEVELIISEGYSHGYCNNGQSDLYETVVLRISDFLKKKGFIRK